MPPYNNNSIAKEIASKEMSGKGSASKEVSGKEFASRVYKDIASKGVASVTLCMLERFVKTLVVNRTIIYRNHY